MGGKTISLFFFPLKETELLWMECWTASSVEPRRLINRNRLRPTHTKQPIIIQPSLPPPVYFTPSPSHLCQYNSFVVKHRRVQLLTRGTKQQKNIYSYHVYISRVSGGHTIPLHLYVNHKKKLLFHPFFIMSLLSLYRSTAVDYCCLSRPSFDIFSVKKEKKLWPAGHCPARVTL